MIASRPMMKSGSPPLRMMACSWAFTPNATAWPKSTDAWEKAASTASRASVSRLLSTGWNGPPPLSNRATPKSAGNGPGGTNAGDRSQASTFQVPCSLRQNAMYCPRSVVSPGRVISAFPKL
jgi:hypothetical protein